MVTGAVISGSRTVREIVWTPAPGMLNPMVPPPAPLALRIASRSEPGIGAVLLPLSAVVVTVNVPADLAGRVVAMSASPNETARAAILILMTPGNVGTSHALASLRI